MSIELVMKSLEQIESGIDRYGAKIRTLEDEVLQLKQKTGNDPRLMAAMATQPGPAFGKKVIAEIEKNGELIGKSPHVRLQIKAATDALTTSDARTVTGVGVGAPVGGVLGVQNALTTRPIGLVSAAEYSRYTGMQGAAAKQSAEGAAKSAARPNFSIITETAATIAGFTKVSKQALGDSAELATAIDTTLRRSIGVALDSFLMTGSWGGAAGLLAHATAHTSLVYASLADAVSEAVAGMQTAGFSPDAVCMTPSDWLSIITQKASGSGEYLSGSYLNALPENLRGLRVVLSPTVTSGKALLLDSAHVELLVVEDLAVEIGTDQDDFTRNQRTLLAEMRVIPTFRAVGAVTLVTHA